MMEVRLTKEARRVLKSIYDIYCERRESGKSRSESVDFAPKDSGGPEIPGLDDVEQELEKAKFLVVNIIDGYTLTDDAIVFMENLTKDSILKWLEFGSNFIP